jgi:hypothetical protein
MKTILKRIGESLRRAWQRRETERQLAQLDARMLRDIGLESWNSGQAAGRLWAHRIGLYY